MTNKTTFFAVILTLALMLGGQSLLFGSGFDVLVNRPATDSASYFSVWSPKTLKRAEWEAGSSVQFLYRPFQLFENGQRSRGVIDALGVQHLQASLGVVNQWLEMGIDLPVVWGFSFQDPNAATPSTTTQAALGDIQFHLKSRLYQSPTDFLRIGLLSTVSTPTGSHDRFLGSDTPTFTEKVLLEILPWEKWSLGLNLGIGIEPNGLFRDIRYGDQLIVGVGGRYDVSRKISILSEIDHQTRLQDPYARRVETPLEAQVGVQYCFEKTGLVLKSGAGVGLLYGSGAPLLRFFTGVSYVPSLKKSGR